MVTVIVCPGESPVMVQLTKPNGNETPDGLPDVGRLPSETDATDENVPALVERVIGPAPVADWTLTLAAFVTVTVAVPELPVWIESPP